MENEMHKRVGLSGTIIGHNVLVSRLTLLIQQYNASAERLKYELDDLRHQGELRYAKLENEGATPESLANLLREIEALNSVLDKGIINTIQSPKPVRLDGIIAKPKVATPTEKPSYGWQPPGVLPSYME